MNIGNPLPQHLYPLLESSFSTLSKLVRSYIPLLEQARVLQSSSDKSKAPLWVQDYLKGLEPRLLIFGIPGMGQQYLGSALIDILQKSKFFIQTIDLVSISSSIELVLLYQSYSRIPM